MLEKLSKVEMSTELHDRGRVLFTARGRRAFVDAPLALGGPNEEPTSIELLLAALASEATFILEHAARQEGIPLRQVTASAEALFNPLGLIGGRVESAFHRLQLRLVVSGPSAEQAILLQQRVQLRCPIYNLLAQRATIDMQVVAAAA
jgi:uncharacterized OsmC-like protein